MFRVICYILLIIALGLGFTWLANNPTDLIIPFAGQRIVVPLLLAVSILVIALLALWFIWWLISAILRSPFVLNRKMKESRKRRGELALSQGLIAVLSGDGANAYRLSKRADKLLDDENNPLHQLLNVRALLLNDDHKEAISLYEKMRKNPDTKLLALQGLYHEAMKSAAYEAAGQYAEEAVKLVPTLTWANRAVLDKYAIEGEWNKALSLLASTQKALPKSQRNDAKSKHLNAVLLTGEAMECFENNPDEARALAIKATKLDPDFIPAAAIASSILFKLHQTRAGNKIIENLWQSAPHPDLAKIYVNADTGERAADRLKRAQKLAALNVDHFESLMIVARTAFEAGQIELAYSTATKALLKEPRESTYLLLADIEELHSGEQGRIRQWLTKAVHAEKDFAWIENSVIFEKWAPVSPITGRLDAFEWKKPVSYLSHQDHHLEDNKDDTQHIALHNDIADADVIELETAPLEKAPQEVSLEKKEEMPVATDKTISTPKKSTNTDHNAQTIITKDKLESPFNDATFIEDDKATQNPMRINVDDPGVENPKYKK